jgi:hypothetical protein
MRKIAALAVLVAACNMICGFEQRFPDHKPVAAQTAVKSEAQGNPSGAIPPTRASAQQAPSEDVAIQRKLAWFTGALVVVGVLQGVVMFLTWLVYRRQAREMRRQRHEMRQQRHFMWRQWKMMGAQLSQMENAGTQTDQLIAQATAQAEKAGIAAEAARKSADVAAIVSIPTLRVEKFELGNAGNTAITAILQFPKVNIVIRNHGQTPAFLRWWSIVFTCEELPPTPNYSGYPGCGVLLDKLVVEPNTSYTLPELLFPHRQEIPIDDALAIIERKKILCAYGYICYGDIFGNPLRRLKFGEFVLNLGDDWIQWSDMDDPRYCGIDLYPFKRPGIKVEREGPGASPDDETKKAN